MYVHTYPIMTGEWQPLLWRWEVRGADDQLARIGTAGTREDAERAAEEYLHHLAIN